ncbi:30S ribosome-binding factor RbfA [uncultured Victivallis sp.]|uniref:30S ribosome-binding factor RbfA n=1 Tax=uncultured Victivallis sp. TaxID=354118 RepID=UPI0025F4BB26|nr:30S ribosome-binding factor RbfA [uncultured Victivallis sp.]
MAEKVDRLARVNALMKRELAETFERDLLVPPGMLVSVTEVKASVDLRNATVYVSIFGGKASDREAIMHELSVDRAGIQARVGRNLAFKHTPVLDFRLDTRTEKGDRVLELLQQAEEEEKKRNE